MSLIRRTSGLRPWDPFRELEDVSSRLNQLFRSGELAKREGGDEALAPFDWSPSVNIAENDKSYVIRADLPGVQKKDIHVTVDKGILTIEGERKETKKTDDEKYHRVESVHGTFMRRFTLPEDAVEEEVAAKTENGTLEVTIPKAGERRTKARKIDVG